jgi:hypothetical protein
MELETRYRVFKIVRTPASRKDIYEHVLEGCSAEEYTTETDAKNWIIQHGDFRNAQHDYVILPCLKPVNK